MFEILSIIIFIWLLGKTIKLALKLTWSAAKIVAAILLVVAAPLLVAGLVLAWGLVLLVPLVLAAIALGLVKLCL